MEPWKFKLNMKVNSKPTKRRLSVGTSACIALLSLGVQGADYQVPEWAGAESSEHSAWDAFTTAFGDPGNIPDVEGSTGTAILTQTTPGATVTGSGNIYNPAGASRFEIAEEFDASIVTVVLHVETAGTELDYESLLLVAGPEGSAEIAPGERQELSRVATGFGETVLSRWEWNLEGSGHRSFVVRFASAGAHSSLAAARLDVRLEADAIHLAREEPAMDRWGYPFNSTPGTRAVASTFASEETGVGLRRHGIFVFGFETGPEVPAGLDPAQYEIISAHVVLTTSSNFEIEYDPSYDPTPSYLLVGHEQRQPDSDAGRPLELFGAGFRAPFSAANWEETSPYTVDSGQRAVFPGGHGPEEEMVEAWINYAEPSEVLPFGVGTIEGLEPGSPVPEDAAVRFEMDLSQAGTVDYLRQSLAAGRLFFTAASLHRGGREVRSFPEYYTRDSLIGGAPRLELSVRVVNPAPPLAITSIRMEEGNPVLRFSGNGSSRYQIRYTSDYQEWVAIEQPEFVDREGESMEWKDLAPAADARFYQVLGLND